MSTTLGGDTPACRRRTANGHDHAPLPLLALALAADGVPVFACGPDKKPLAGTHGFLDASTDPAIVARMFADVAATLIGVPTGEASGLDVLDVDPRHQGDDWLSAWDVFLPATREHRTMSGGRHLVFRHAAGVRNSAGRIAPGVDVRGEGGYVCWPGSPGYSEVDHAEPAEWPGFLLKPGLALPKERPPEPVSSSPYVAVSGSRMAGFIAKILANVSEAIEGKKHSTLRDNALALGGVQIEAGFSDHDAIEWLMDALPSANDWDRARQTARWGLAAGRDKPIRLADRDAVGDEVFTDLREPGERRRGTDELNEVVITDAQLELLSVANWRTRHLPQPERLLGHIIVTGSRMHMSAKTGVGKTHVCLAAAAGMVTGNGFCHWHTARPCRVLYIDGEMSRDLMKERILDVIAREHDPAAVERLENNLKVMCMEDFDAAPFNTAAGRALVTAMVERLGDIDVVIFDNRQSLSEGEMKDEEPWRNMLPLVEHLSRNRIAQVWVDHMGLDGTHSYGTSTKEWRADVVMQLTALDNPPADLAFRVTFTKARRRRPDNRADFETVDITLTDGEWGAEVAAAEPVSQGKAKGPRLGAAAKVALSRLRTAVMGHGESVPEGEGFPADPTRGVPLKLWRTAVYDAMADEKPETQRRYYNRARTDLMGADLIDAHEGWVWLT